MKPMPMTTRLALLGAIPFIFSTLLLSLDILNLPVVGSVVTLLGSYTLVIAVFMCGVHWGQYLQQSGNKAPNLLIISNVLTVLLWIVWLIVPIDIFLMLALAVFLILLYIDMRLRMGGIISKTYFRTRLLVTTVVCACLLLAIYAI
jgi:hypothetical protein